MTPQGRKLLRAARVVPLVVHAVSSDPQGHKLLRAAGRALCASTFHHETVRHCINLLCMAGTASDGTELPTSAPEGEFQTMPTRPAEGAQTQQREDGTVEDDTKAAPPRA